MPRWKQATDDSCTIRPIKYSFVVEDGFQAKQPLENIRHVERILNPTHQMFVLRQHSLGIFANSCHRNKSALHRLSLLTRLKYASVAFGNFSINSSNCFGTRLAKKTSSSSFASQCCAIALASGSEGMAKSAS